MIMIDPKMLELSIYEGIPHLLALCMKLAAKRAELVRQRNGKTYRLMSFIGVRNLAVTKKLPNRRAWQQPTFSLTPENPEPLGETAVYRGCGRWVCRSDDDCGQERIEELIARLAQKARAAGIHLILATALTWMSSPA